MLSNPNLHLSLKWVEAPGYGDGGPNWVEVRYEHNSVLAVDSAAGSYRSSHLYRRYLPCQPL